MNVLNIVDVTSTTSLTPLPRQSIFVRTQHFAVDSSPDSLTLHPARALSILLRRGGFHYVLGCRCIGLKYVNEERMVKSKDAHNLSIFIQWHQSSESKELSATRATHKYAHTEQRTISPFTSMWISFRCLLRVHFFPSCTVFFPLYFCYLFNVIHSYKNQINLSNECIHRRPEIYIYTNLYNQHIHARTPQKIERRENSRFAVYIIAGKKRGLQFVSRTSITTYNTLVLSFSSRRFYTKPLRRTFFSLFTSSIVDVHANEYFAALFFDASAIGKKRERADEMKEVKKKKNSAEY